MSIQSTKISTSVTDITIETTFLYLVKTKITFTKQNKTKQKTQPQRTQPSRVSCTHIHPGSENTLPPRQHYLIIYVKF
ncbi:hypothetical protein DERF_010796 [Dermatophagoides farinae]|uniref:Uncharacterized protein n=1 Tax=Dermatophagoides farinae TaxID=6954 RepID=A0A922KYL3_DERFA|nr:hypothetical protein DERF_010796 [Dermatophagoides farinae]